MGMVTALRFVESLYRGAILGLQKQVWLSLSSSLLATIRGLGSILVLVYVAPSIIDFFIWQVIASLLTLAILVYGAYSFLPLFPNRARFSWDHIKGVWKFSGGMLLTALLTILLTQVDKVILSRMLSLELYGYYALAGLVTGVLYQITGPITQAYYPRFTAHVTNNETDAVIDLYHQASQIISVLLIPASIMLIIYGDIILKLWTGNANLVVNVSPLVSILAAGTLLNGLMHVPYILTVAYGWPSFAVRQNLIAVLILIPAIVYVVPKYGAIGAAWIWFMLNIGYLFIAAAYIFRRLISSEKRKWYIYDLFLPTIGALSTVFIFSFFRPTINNVIGTWIWLMLTGTTMVICSAFMANQLRPKILKIFI
jgi:O-antigen/teichoic acid export membrane protein